MIFTTVSLSTKDLKLKKYSKNVVKIYLKANYKTRYKFKKKIYNLKENVPGTNIPHNNCEMADIVIQNDLNKKITKIEQEFWSKLKKIYPININ